LIVLITPRLHADGSTFGAEEGAQMSQKLESLREQIRMLD
jgi:hypothetical protein